MSGSSPRLVPCGPTPVSVPIAMRTPASAARATEASCTFWTATALASIASGSDAPPATASRTARGADSVGTSQVPRSSMRSIASSSRKMPCSIERIPARTAALMPAVLCACAITATPAASASSTRTSSSAGGECGGGGAEGRVLRVVAGGEDAAAGGHLEHVGAGAQQLPDGAAHLVRPVDDRPRPAGVRLQVRHLRAADVPAVAVATGLAQHADRDLHPRAGDEAVAHRLGDAEIRATGVADVGDAQRQRPAQVVQRLVERVAERRLQPPEHVDAAHHHVHVAVEEAGEHGRAGAVDDLVAVQPDAHLDDPPVLDDDVRLRRGTAGAVEDLPAAEQLPCHGGTLGLTR